VVRNNTAYHNNWDKTNDATWRGELSCVNSSDVKWYNNIAVAFSAVNVDNTARSFPCCDPAYGRPVRTC
jgi:hypothetical protein